MGEKVPAGSRWPVHHQLLIAFSHSNREMIARTRAIGLMPGQPKVLEYLAHHEGAAQHEIARGCGMDRSTVTSVLVRMEEAGLIERAASPRDRRVVTVALTQAGRERAQQVCAFGDELDAACLQGFSEAERDALTGMLGRLIDNLEQSQGGAR